MHAYLTCLGAVRRGVWLLRHGVVSGSGWPGDGTAGGDRRRLSHGMRPSSYRCGSGGARGAHEVPAWADAVPGLGGLHGVSRAAAGGEGAAGWGLRERVGQVWGSLEERAGRGARGVLARRGQW